MKLPVRSVAFKVLLGACLLSGLVINLLLLALPLHRSSSSSAGRSRSLSLNWPVDSGTSRHLGRSRRISQHDSLAHDGDARPSVGLEVWCGGQYTALAIDSVLLVNDTTPGAHVFIINQATASLMGHHPVGSWDQAQSIALSVSAGRLLVLTQVAQAAADASARPIPQRSRQATTWAFLSLGSREFESLRTMDSWILISFAKVGRIREKRLTSGKLLRLSASVKLTLKEDPICPHWPVGAETARRRQFCGHADGLSNVCSCADPGQISFEQRPLTWFANQSAVVPITVMSSNRPQFLYRMLTSLLQLPGLNASQVNVLLRGYFDDPRLICELLQLPHSQYKQLADSSSNLYRLAMADTLRKFETAQFLILLDDDIDPSPDLIDFFNQTLPLFAADSNLFCIGAWNDQSFAHTSPDAARLQPTQVTPLKAVAFRRRVWEEELVAQWPEEPIDLAHWLSQVMGPRRYCLKPVLSRVFAYSQSVQLMRSHSPRHLTAASGDGRLLVQSMAEYDREIQELLNRAININERLRTKGSCGGILQFAKDLGRNVSVAWKNQEPALVLTAKVSSRSGLMAFWRTVVARCFLLHPVASCLYKGVCMVRFDSFILLVNFSPFSQFVVSGQEADIIYP